MQIINIKTSEGKAALQSLCEAATPGDWAAGPGYVSLPTGSHTMCCELDGDDTYPQSFRDAAFVAAARKALLAALSLIDEQAARIAELEADLLQSGRR